ncbi:MAG: hypothetical protein V3U59_00150 [Gammaproteobacteria bacterium]
MNREEGPQIWPAARRNGSSQGDGDEFPISSRLGSPATLCFPTKNGFLGTSGIGKYSCNPIARKLLKNLMRDMLVIAVSIGGTWLLMLTIAL